MKSLEKLNLPNVSLRQISMFLAVVHRGTIRAASEELGVTQGAISQGIKEAEKQLGCELFYRQGRTLVLNGSGRILLPRMEELHRQAVELKDILYDPGENQRGHLHIGASSTIGCYLLPEIIASFQSRFPQVKIDLYVNNTKDIISVLKEGRVDIAFVEGMITTSDLCLESFMTDELIVFCHADHPLASRKSLKWKDLSDETWLIRENGSGTYSYFISHCVNESIQLSRTINIGNNEAILRCVEAGLGIACLSRLAVQRSLEIGVLKALPVKAIPRKFHFVKNKSHHLGRVENLFLSELEQHPLVDKNLSVSW